MQCKSSPRFLSLVSSPGVSSHPSPINITFFSQYKFLFLRHHCHIILDPTTLQSPFLIFFLIFFFESLKKVPIQTHIMTMTSSTSSSEQAHPPSEFVCPLTNKPMKQPMMSRYGNHFEKVAILEWLSKGNNFCPVTGNPLRPSNLVSDKTLQWKIEYWARKHGVELDDGCVCSFSLSWSLFLFVMGALD